MLIALRNKILALWIWLNRKSRKHSMGLTLTKEQVKQWKSGARLLPAHLIGVWGGMRVLSSSDIFFGVLSTWDLKAGKQFKHLYPNSTFMQILCTEKKENLHVNFRRKNSLISIQKQPSIKVSAPEVMFLVLLVEAFSLWWKLKSGVTRS